ncbi:aminopeptidase [Salinispira pacifica]|uniref:Aminopeptidase n=1 Tax=Salinispira pacifica TaxID=1307761 RepID=V5WIF6_9SPIO|nr:aminopeptidase [Salinispira pacifica]AHC15558.1 hypothetical protein L21SP2_2195 [Salinispira pacifica]
MILAVVLFSSCYYVEQGSVLFRNRLAAQSRSAALKSADESRQEELERFFTGVERIRDFGVERLGLNDNGNYRKYLELDRDYLVAVVNAAAPDSLDPFLWRYPFLGPAPYRGYYNPEDAAREARRLRDKGYHVFVRKVDGFSTLGITKDPLISFMTEYDQFRLARLIFHEQIHASFWVKGHISFNEELATTLGDMAALEYIEWYYGTDSREYRSAEASIHDSRQFAADMRTLSRELEILYESFPETFSEKSPPASAAHPPSADRAPEQADEQAPESSHEQTPERASELEAARERILERFREQFRISYPERYEGDAYRNAPELELNNAFLSLYRSYSGRGPGYQALYERLGSVSAVLQTLETAMKDPESMNVTYRKGDDPYTIIEQLLES